MSFRAPKAIASHPGVECVEDATRGSFDYRYDVELKQGWCFTRGRMAGCSNARFNSVAEFKEAAPSQVSA